MPFFAQERTFLISKLIPSLDFSFSDDVLFDLINSFPEPAHIKDIKTKKYICSNMHNLKIYGLNDPKNIVGLTVHDLDDFMRPYWGTNFAHKINELDVRVEKEILVVDDKNRIFLDKFGLVHIQNMTKVPLLSEQKKVNAILTLSFDTTSKLDNLIIFDTYLKIYRKKREACFYFMHHLNIHHFFTDILSVKEIICLLHMTKNKLHKYIAAKMNIGLKTVETHISNINNKLNKKDLADLLEFIRITNHYEK